ncbi:MAG: hypothetical protein E6K80_07905 [Candidatus Eisenbacteria bacterium]|uniref:Uncharacterized protein n=1 Tax=Eiseniibacteriota bacterium TaxID=2212470 RepID=A0A538U430_UNCEI|nr:MAG: hypothetical protein E6K80_07905 [Candidatus Eisenbacteria bacterium]
MNRVLLGLLAGLLAFGSAAAPRVAASSRQSPDWRGVPRKARAACDSLRNAVARATRLAPRRSRGEINPIYRECRRPAARFELAWRGDTQEPPDPFEIVDREARRMGWTLDPASHADGTDGMVYAFTRGKLMLVVEGRWDGGDGTDTTRALDPAKSLWVDVADAKPCPKNAVND